VSADSFTFCEGFYQRTNADVVELVPTFSIRGLVKVEPPYFPQLSTWAFDSLRRGLDGGRVLSLIEDVGSKWLAKARHMGTPLHLPFFSGGLGLPSPNPSKKMSVKNALLLLGSLDLGVRAPVVAVRSKGPYNTASKIAADVRYSVGVPKGQRCPHWESHEAQLLSRESTINFLLTGSPAKMLSTGLFLRKLKAIRLDLSKRYNRELDEIPTWKLAQEPPERAPVPSTIKTFHQCPLWELEVVHDIENNLGTDGSSSTP